MRPTKIAVSCCFAVEKTGALNNLLKIYYLKITISGNQKFLSSDYHFFKYKKKYQEIQISYK